MPFNNIKGRKLQLPKDHNLKIWRYMDFGKFMHMIETGTLYFSTLNELKDFFEGKYPKMFWNSSKEMETRKKLSEIENKINKIMTINCWNLSQNESLGLWSVYVNGRGVAIQTTIKKLIQSLTKSIQDIEIGSVRYIDYNKANVDGKNIYSLVSYKRKIFEFEKELRLFYIKNYEKELGKKGEYVEIDLEKLDPNIILSPASQQWYKGTIESVLLRSGWEKLADKIRFSDLDEMPNYNQYS